jgi:tetratricopeptide (TPR) repeat protein
MFRDTFDKLSWLILVIAVLSLVVLLYVDGGTGSDKRTHGPGKALERELAYRSRVELISTLFAPVEKLRKEGNNQTALLKLDELIKKYPGEGHGHILQGEILYTMGAFDEAVASYVEGIKLNGDYVDAKSSLSRRAEIQHLVEEGLKNIGQRSAANPDNRTLAAFRQKINYLKSRLAGGCE